MEVDASDIQEIKGEIFDCVICRQSSQSTEDAPVGLVVLLQSSSGIVLLIKIRIMEFLKV